MSKATYEEDREYLKKAIEKWDSEQELAQVTGGVSPEKETLLRGVESEKLAAVYEMVKSLAVDFLERT